MPRNAIAVRRISERMDATNARRRKRRRRAVGVSLAAALLVIAAAAWHIYSTMSEKLVEVLADDAVAELEPVGSVEGAALPDSAASESLGSHRSDSAGGEIGSAASNGKQVDSSLGNGGEGEHSASTDDDGVQSLPPSGETEAESQRAAAGTSGSKGRNPVDVAAAAGHVSVKDKLTIGKVVLKHWDAEELHDMSAKLSGGLTIAEKRELKKEALAKLTPQEYDKLIAIAKKLGLSRGKNYAQSREEK